MNCTKTGEVTSGHTMVPTGTGLVLLSLGLNLTSNSKDKILLNTSVDVYRVSPRSSMMNLCRKNCSTWIKGVCKTTLLLFIVAFTVFNSKALAQGTKTVEKPDTPAATASKPLNDNNAAALTDKDNASNPEAAGWKKILQKENEEVGEDTD